MQIIVLELNHGNEYVLLPESQSERPKAFLAAFNILDENSSYDGTIEKVSEATLYHQAKAGDGMAAEKLMRLRREVEYEGWSVEKVVVP